VTRIILLDVDGVLVDPGGYRAALRATINHFIDLMGLPYLEIPEEKLTELEKQGISSEWDMAPLLLAAVWEDILLRLPELDLPAEVSSAAIMIGKNLNGYRPSEIVIPEFTLIPGKYPAEAALQSGCFPAIPIELRKNLLNGSRDIHSSQTTLLFQHYSLGSDTFSQTYNLPAKIKTESLLLIHDRSNINETIRTKLLKPGNYPAGFTARPSGPPRETGISTFGYAPEAEIALELVGLAHIPLMAFGKLEYLAAQHKLAPSTLVKPSPIHALAAVVAAYTGDEWLALQAVHGWHQTGELTDIAAKLPQSFELIVVEDTLGGIHSVKAAGRILQEAGFDVTLRPFGLTSGSAAKAAAFEKFQIPHFTDWETMIAKMDL
jgi:hypothetical protein